MSIRWFLAVGLSVALAAVAAASGGSEDRFMPDPNNARVEEAPSLPSVGGKYRVLLRKIYVPQDKAGYGLFTDYGMYTGNSWAGFNDLPPGHWVYVYPHWYIWRDLVNPNPKQRIGGQPPIPPGKIIESSDPLPLERAITKQQDAMKYVYFTKMLKALDLKALIAFCKDVGLDGVDLAVRPDYPVNPTNMAKALPEAAKALAGEGLTIGLVTADTNVNDPGSKTAKALFEASAAAGVPAIKIGYFPYKNDFDANFKDARTKLTGFAKLAEEHKVRACVHTHSGNYIPNNCAMLRMLLQDMDAHHVGAFVDTGHTAVNGGPFRMEVDLVRPYLSLIAIKDMVWDKGAKAARVVPAGEGIVHWNEVAKAVEDCKFKGTICLHGEYETKEQAERLQKAKDELALLKKLLA